VQVIARSGDALLLGDGAAGAILYPDGDSHVAQLAVLSGHGQWRASDEAVPGYAPAGLPARLVKLRQQLETGAP
jgi:hypothetical protein